jgi:hypothetical protein
MSLDRRKPGVIGALALLALALGLSPAFAQGTQTGVITGIVHATDGAALPGVTVTLSSPVLQGVRSITTDATGAYHFRALPPGNYKVSFALSGFGDVERNVALALGAASDLPATMSVASMAETVEVLGGTASILDETQVATSYEYEDVVDRLAVNRNLSAIADLAPGLSDNGPNLNQVAIGGAFAYDNVFLLNGVDINDNLFGTPTNLFIEDALQEISIMTSGINAEYGRFSGGVINAVTKSGGNQFQGSFRTDMTNPKWQDESLVEKNAIAAGRGQPHIDDTGFAYSATLGGPVVKDRLWFFGAYRHENSAEARALSVTGEGYTYGLANRRYEGKLTGSITANHKLSVDYVRRSNDETNAASINTTLSIDGTSLVDRKGPADLLVARYDGVLSPNFYAEAQYSRKQASSETGGSDTAITASPFLALGRAGLPANSHYHAPYFSRLDPEDRNNRQYAGALSYFLSTGRGGRHDLKLGGEYFTSSRTGGNSQSVTGYVFLADPVVVGGQPQRDSAGNMIPNFQPGLTQVQNWRSLQGAQINLNTAALYLNDRWQLNSRWSFNLGVRFERHTTDATQAGITSISSSAIAPRLGATFDVKGDGRWILQATYGHYAGKVAETQFADNTNVGTPSLVQSLYTGPAGTGVGFSPGFNLANYSVVGGNFPVANVFLDEGLNTPVTREWTLQAGSRLGNRGEVKAVYTNRSTSNFLEDFITIDLGKTTVVDGGVNFGTFDNVNIRNSDEPHYRAYQGLMLLVNYRFNDKWYVGGNWTHQFKNEGNFEGEAANQPGNYSIIGDRPEFYSEARHYPTGRLANYQADKVRLYTIYDVPLGSAGTVSLGGIYRYDSPTTYSLFATGVPVTPQQLARNPGYARPPTTNNPALFFGDERGIGEFESAHILDLTLSYEVPVYKTARPFLKVEFRNAFNSQPLIGYNTTVAPDLTSPRDALGLPTGYTRGANFGNPVNNHTATAPHVPFPREVRFSVGFRF